MGTKQHSAITGSDLHIPKTHTSSHTDGTDDIQSATSGQKGLATPSQIGKLDGIETAADVTDSANVDAAGAAMDSEYALDEIMVGTGAGTHHQITLNASEFLARKGTGNVANVTGPEARTILNVENGATKYPDTGEQAFLDADHTKLDGIDTGATDDQTGAEIKAAYEAEADTNVFTDTEQTKLTGIENSADVTDATNVGAAGAMMDSDISEGEGFLRKTGAGAYEGIKSNLGASTAPTVNDDSGDGYAIGSIWIDGTAVKAYVCLDPTMAAAVWKETTVTAGGGDMLKSTYDPNDDGIIDVAQTEATKYPDTGEQAFLDADHTKLDGIEVSADVTDSTNVAAAGAVMDSDISEVEGFMRKTGAGTYEAIKSNMSAAVSPTANDDSSSGYTIGSPWLDTTADKGYVCLDASVGAAVWKETTGAGSGLANIVEDTTPQLGGDLDLNGHEILLDTTPGTDHTASGTKSVFTNGNAGAVAFGDVCYMALDGDLEFADADASTTMPALYMALADIAAAASGEWLIMGVARDDTWDWTIGPGAAGLIYVSLTGTSANTLTQTKPSATGDQVQIVGTAISADTMMFSPSPVLVEIT